jgi:thymidylate synthase
MEWFLSGDTKCPDELLDWWDGQLSPLGRYEFGYTYQLKRYGGYHDQITTLIDGIIEHPHSRRHIITTWNPYEMDVITQLNQNTKTPTTCHNTISQFFVRGQNLYLTTYQRSADLLLGVPHNWIQTWALLLWVAYNTKYTPASMQWNFGDAHIYTEQSHLKVANDISQLREDEIKDHDAPLTLRYINNHNTEFKQIEKGTFQNKSNCGR